MKKKILLLAFAVLFSTVNGFAESTSAYWGRIALLHTNYSNAFSEFKEGAEEGMFADCYGPLAVMYAMGLGTPKNPQLAYKYLKLYEENDGFYYQDKIGFWLDFYLGKEISEWIAYSTFREVPKVMAFFKSENYTCKAFGQSPDMKKALEFLYAHDNLQFSSAKGVLKSEKYSEPFLQYALKENDFKLMKMIDEANPNKFAVLEEKDAENYQKLSKDAESLKKFVDETAITNKWREAAKKEYFDTQLNEVFKDGGYNQELDDLAREVAYSWDMNEYYKYRDKSSEMYYSLFDSLVAAGEWEKVMSLSDHYDNGATKLLKVAKTLEPIRAKMKSGSISNGELSSAFGSLENEPIYGESNKKIQDYVSSVISDIYTSWDKKSNYSEMLKMLKMFDFEGAEKSRGEFHNILKEECKTWDATTDFQYMEDMALWSNECFRGWGIASHYPRAIGERIGAWTIDTEAGELDAVYDNINSTYLSSYLDFPDYRTAYRVNIEQRLKAVKKIKDVEEAYAKISEIKGMRHIGEWPDLTEKVEKLYEKYAKKMQKLQK